MRPNAKILVTGGCGFIGSAVVRRLVKETEHRVVIVDALTYAATPEAIAEVAHDSRCALEQVNIRERPALDRVFAEHAPDAVMHLAAESHVDRSIDGPDAFLMTNVFGTFALLEATRNYWRDLDQEARANGQFCRGRSWLLARIMPTGPVVMIICQWETRPAPIDVPE